MTNQAEAIVSELKRIGMPETTLLDARHAVDDSRTRILDDATGLSDEIMGEQ